MTDDMQEFWTFFAFPLNLLLALIWTAGWGLMRKNHPECAAVRFLLSPYATISSIALLIAACLWLGLSGDRGFVQSVVFVVILLYIQTVLFMVLLRGWRRNGGEVRWRFVFLHAGLLLAVGAGFWGSPDSSEFRMRLHRGETSNVAYRLDGNSTVLTYELTLDDYVSEISEEGQPVHYEAYLTMSDGKQVSISVNHPYSVNMGEAIYLASLSEGSCVLQIVREPWRYFALAGIILMLAGAFMLFIKGPRR